MVKQIEASCRKLRNRGNKGFTLMEMLIVVAIIAVLIAIAIPVFSTQLEKSREATDMANVRSAYGTITAQFIEDGSAHAIEVAAEQNQDEWQTQPQPYLELMSEDGASQYTFSAKTDSFNVSIDTSGNLTVN